MRFKRRIAVEKGLIDMTPMVNIFFLLFIFFMFTSSFIFQPGIKVNLPKAVTGEVVQGESAVIIVTKDDRLFQNEREISGDEFISNLRIIAKAKGSLLIKADGRASLGKVVEMWDLCRSEGVSQVSIATMK